MNEPTVQKTILVVDDEDNVREAVKEVLRDEGYRVVDTSDATRVLNLIEEEKPGLVCVAPRHTDQHHAMGMAALEAGAHQEVGRKEGITAN